MLLWLINIDFAGSDPGAPAGQPTIRRWRGVRFMATSQPLFGPGF